MLKTFFGTKIGMTHSWSESGDWQAVTRVGIGEKIADIFSAGDKVKVSGTTKGKGFSGVVKRWGFSGGPRTHGQSDRHRAPGSIGQGTTPGRVFKGKKMAGRGGGRTKTILGIKVVKVDGEKNELWVGGAVPGSKGGKVKVTKTISSLVH